MLHINKTLACVILQSVVSWVAVCLNAIANCFHMHS